VLVRSKLVWMVSAVAALLVCCSETFVLRSTDAETGDPMVLRVERRGRLMFLAAEVE